MVSALQTEANDTVTSDTMIPDLFHTHPHTRQVFDRYGLSGCGGRSGPAETIKVFARAHGVDEGRLLAEIHETVTAPVPDEPAHGAPTPSLADTIYRRFFLGAVVLILTAGASWGVWLLWQIGVRGKFTGVSIHHVNAHGHAQIYGWVGLFMMGFAYQAFPRMWQTQLKAPRLAAVAFVLMVVGLIVRTAGMTASGLAGHALCAAMFGGAVEILAVLIFAGQMVATFRSSTVRVEPYLGFVFAALFWFVAQSGLDVWHTYTTMTAQTAKELVWYVSTYQAPLRDLQIHGLALSMILGVCLRMLPALFDVPKTPTRRAWVALAMLTISVAGETVLFIAYRWSNNHVLAAFLMIPWLTMTVAVVMVAWPWKLWRPLPSPDRVGKFVRAAYLWLAISLVMLLLLPVYQQVSGIKFSHAYYGAIRHAITVGFISMMIMGFGAKVTATLNGHRKLTGLWFPFVLVNLGCFLRCSLQIGTDWHATFFPLVGISGTLEVIGLAWWSGHLVLLMRTTPTVDPEPSAAVTIEPDASVAAIVDRYPQTLHVFAAYGFTPLRSPLARKTVARGITVRQAAKFRSICADELLLALRLAAGVHPTAGGRACSGCDHH